ncbi:MAG: H4MPT-linked C1 transfer pathway protein [Burkholderiales bacterium]|nr:H4MPT-linked C1 transfer pathway protein [Burkholderiales bacterium]
MPERNVIGWDIGGAHVKAARLSRGALLDAAQWPCALWKGVAELETALAAALARWPDLARQRHAVTMTGEMVDAFANREDGVRRIARVLGRALPQPRFFAGDAGWCGALEAGATWQHIASANWLATAQHTACLLQDSQGVLVDIGSTTTDLIPFRDGRVLTAHRGDALRLEHSELVYQGVVRTPLCALAQRIGWQHAGRATEVNVMNEFFATTADVYRLTGELDAAHDQHPAADNGAKDAAGSRARLARMIGLDARDATDFEWHCFAQGWRAAQLTELRQQLGRVLAAHALHAPVRLVGAGCGAFLVPELARSGWCHVNYAPDLVRIAPQAPADTAAWAQVCAPSVAVAALFEKEHD